jgi:hypothetical protein
VRERDENYLAANQRQGNERREREREMVKIPQD